MRIATWNVNSIRARLPRVTEWLARWSPDVLCMQETKVVDDQFPRDAFAHRGYQLEVFGQKTYNGVALASRGSLTDLARGFPDDAPDADRRLIAGRIADLHVINVYVPNGTELGSPRFAGKLAWFGRLRDLLERTFSKDDPLIICGDFNVAPEDRDVHDPEAWRGKLLFHPDEHRALQHLMSWGLTDVFREHHPEEGLFSWWDYRGGAFHRGWGLRIDYLLVTAPVAARTRAVTIDREARKGNKPSDHAPVILDLED